MRSAPSRLAETLSRQAVAALLAGLICAGGPAAEAQLAENETLFSADRVIYDEAARVVRASGQVELVRGPYILRADQVSYDQRDGSVTARGEVALLDEDGNVVFGSLMRLSEDLQTAFIDQVRGLFSDDSRFAGRRAERREGNVTVIEQAVYSPCDVCEGEAPLWQIKADRITHDAEAKRVSYKNARLELGGVPVAYTPYFSHADPSVVRKSGFLTPDIGFDSNLGAVIRSYYYWSVRPDLDFTIEGTLTGESGPLLGLEWRQRFANGEISLLGSITRGTTEEGTAGNPSFGEDDFRGHIMGGGRFDLNEHWRTSFQIEEVTDDNYLRTYDYSEDDVLVSQAALEGFWRRSYLRARAFSVTDLRPGIRQEQPLVVPDLRFWAWGRPGATFGGRWSFEAGLLNLFREPGTDVRRASAELGWRRQWIAPVGLITTLRARVGGDVYWVTDRSGRDATPDDDDIVSRLFPQMQVELRYPLIRYFANGNAMIEPIVALDAAPTVIGEATGVPNEDSRDVELDATNLLGPQRFPGRDRREDGVRGTIGIKASLNGLTGGYSSIFLGQSYRIVGNNPFPEGSGLEDDASDIVGQIQLLPGRFIDLDYRFRLDADDFEDRLHELSGSIGSDRFRLYANYLFVPSVAGGGIDDDRNELSLVAQSRIADRWRATISATNRLGSDPGFLRGGAQLIYEDECFLFSANFLRDLTDRLGDDDETTFFLRLSFKNLGDFESPNIVDQITGLAGREN